jgi:hypothetical protein
MSGPTKREIAALGMLQRLAHATDGRPEQWSPLDLIVQKPEHVHVLQFAIKRGWILFSPSASSVCLTDKGCRLARSR